MLFIVVLSRKKKKRLNSEFGRLTALSEAGKPSQDWRKKWLRILRLWGFRITQPGCARWRTFPAYFHRPVSSPQQRPNQWVQMLRLRKCVFLFFLSSYFSPFLFSLSFFLSPFSFPLSFLSSFLWSFRKLNARTYCLRS